MAHKHSVYDTDAHFKIDAVTRAIKNDSSGKTVLIQGDHNSERFTFEVPRLVDGHDLSLCNRVQVHYINIDSTDKTKVSKDLHDLDDLQISPDSDDVVICSWQIDGKATVYAGSLNFLLKFKCVSDDGTVEYVWNTAIFTGISISSGIDNGEAIVEDYSDVLEQWRQELVDSGGVTDERIEQAVSDYLAENPVEGGLNSTASALLIAILRNGVYSTNQSANITALEAALASSDSGSGDSSGDSGSGDDSGETEVTLSSISATYSGGDVAVGTAVADLTGVVVTAHYSDGSTATVTGYTLSGTIAEGSNTITVSYGGKITTFTVTGVAESGGETSDILYELPEATTFDGTNAIATDVMLNDTDKDYTVVGEFKFDMADFGKTVFTGFKVSTSIGLKLYTGTIVGAKVFAAMQNGRYSSVTNISFGESGEQTVKFVCVRTASNNTAVVNSVINGERSTESNVVGNTAYSANTAAVTIASDFIGTINDLKIYNRALTSEEVEAYLA